MYNRYTILVVADCSFLIDIIFTVKSRKQGTERNRRSVNQNYYFILFSSSTLSPEQEIPFVVLVIIQDELLTIFIIFKNPEMLKITTLI